jgi:hypothetical protein
MAGAAAAIWITVSLLNKHSRSGIFFPGGFDHLKKSLFGNFLS